MKKELLYIPIFGQGLRATNHIPIDRKAGVSSIKKAVSLAKEKIFKKNKKVIIFPQGTRVPVGKSTEEYPYKVGFVAIIKELKIDIVPLALNTGCFWAKGQFVKNEGKIILRFLPKIEYKDIEKLDKKEIIKKMENIIEGECEKLRV